MEDRESAIRRTVAYTESRGIAYDCLGTKSARFLLDTIDALQSRLAAAERERNEWKDIASVFLAATEPDQPVPVMGKIMLAQVRGRAREALAAGITPAPPKPSGGEVARCDERSEA